MAARQGKAVDGLLLAEASGIAQQAPASPVNCWYQGGLICLKLS